MTREQAIMIARDYLNGQGIEMREEWAALPVNDPDSPASPGGLGWSVYRPNVRNNYLIAVSHTGTVRALRPSQERLIDALRELDVSQP